jgi:hypothetical protein
MSYKSKDKIVYDSATGSTFKEAFADARKEGKKTFEWAGKKYGTKLKGEEQGKAGTTGVEAGIAAAEAQKESRNPNSPRLSSILNVRNRAGKALGAAAEKNTDASEAEQKRVAKLQSTSTGRALTGIQESGIKKRMKANQDTEDAAKKEFEKRDSMARGAYEGQGYDYDAMKKGGKVKKFAGGGMYENVPARGNQKSSGSVRSTATKLPGKETPKKDATPLPEWLKNERENRERDSRVKKEQEAYDKYDKNRLKDQGSFKKGGMASSRGDGIAQRGKTKGRMC